MGMACSIFSDVMSEDVLRSMTFVEEALSDCALPLSGKSLLSLDPTTLTKLELLSLCTVKHGSSYRTCGMKVPEPRPAATIIPSIAQ